MSYLPTAAPTGVATLAAPAGAEIVYTHGEGVGSVLMELSAGGRAHTVSFTVHR